MAPPERRHEAVRIKCSPVVTTDLEACPKFYNMADEKCEC